ncbi:DUF6943 family protein [Flavobacterium sp. GT3P67]|uniref:DUF6943 family protein n=1 Tax=Flavobacterium sp. GT3P67 TaxID=2541722 RepID=UPI003977CF2D
MLTVICLQMVKKYSKDWLVYSIWKSNLWHQFFIGYVMQFLFIINFKKDFD